MSDQQLRELDVEIARNLSGWTDIGWEPVPLLRGSDELMLPGPHGISECGEREPIPRYSSWIAATWTITEKAQRVKLKKEPEFTKDGEWNAVVVIDGSQGEGFGETASLAICRAALKAVEGRETSG